MNGLTIYASADSKYFEEFAPELVYSCHRYCYDVAIELINPTRQVLELAHKMREKFSNFAFYTTNLPDTDRVTYSVQRFLSAPEYMDKYDIDRMLIVDIDSFIMNPIKLPVCDVGLFHREPLPGCVGWEKEGTRIAAGVVLYIGVAGRMFAEEVAKRIKKQKKRWFVDQVTLYQTYEDLKHQVIAMDDKPLDKVYNFADLNNGLILDWEFKPNTYIWSGKGPRKYQNQVFVDAKKKLRERFDD